MTLHNELQKKKNDKKVNDICISEKKHRFRRNFNIGIVAQDNIIV